MANKLVALLLELVEDEAELGLRNVGLLVGLRAGVLPLEGEA